MHRVVRPASISVECGDGSKRVPCSMMSVTTVIGTRSHIACSGSFRATQLDADVIDSQATFLFEELFTRYHVVDVMFHYPIPFHNDITYILFTIMFMFCHFFKKKQGKIIVEDR